MREAVILAATASGEHAAVALHEPLGAGQLGALALTLGVVVLATRS
jgi:hypothetical protein